MLSLKLAWRNLFRNTRRTVLTCLLISCSLVSLILVDGIVLGMADSMVGNITDTLVGDAQVNRKGFRDNYDSDLYLASPEPLLTQLEQDETLAHYAPRVIVGSMIASTYNTSSGLVYGVDAVSELGVSKISDAVYEGEYLSGEKREILLGKPMAELLEVKLGDRIVITTASVATGDITQELFRLSGLFEFGPSELDENVVFINLQQAQHILGMSDNIHQIAVQFNNPEDAKNPELPLFKTLNQGDVEALSWLELEPSLGAVIEMTNYSTAIVGAILFFLASLGVINSMFMSIYERTYEFGVVRAIGTSSAKIIQLILFEALLLSLISCAIGLIIGYFSSSYFSENGIPVGRMELAGVVIDNTYTKLESHQFIAFPIYIIGLTLAAAVYPAIFASGIVPTKALQRTL